MNKAKSKQTPKSMLRLWERLEIEYSNQDQVTEYVSRIEDFDKNLLVIEKPVRLSGNKQLNSGDRIDVTFNRDDAAYRFEALIVSIDANREDIMTIKAVSGINRSQRRRFVRIDIAGEVAFKVVRMTADSEPELSLNLKGELLNISAGGILLNTDASLKRDNLVLLNFWLKNSQRLENVLGVVKRHEQATDDENERVEYLTGIEFLTKDQAASKLALDINEVLPSSVNFFDEALQQAIVQFVYRQQVESRKHVKVKS